MRAPHSGPPVLTSSLLLLLCLAMGVAAWRFLAEPEEAFGPNPLLTLDAGTHVEHHRITRAMVENTGRPWGYNASYLAGYGHTYELSVPILGTMLYGIVNGRVDLAAWRWLEYFLPIVLLPLAVFWAARVYGLGRGRSLLAACWASGYVWLGFPCLFVIGGPVDKMLALALATGAGLLADSAWARGGWKRGAGALVASVLAGYLHRSSVVWLGLILAVSWALHLPRGRGLGRAFLWPAAALLAGVLASAPWVLPMLRFWGAMDPDITRSLSFHSGHILAILEPLIPRATLNGREGVVWGTAVLQSTPWVLGLAASLWGFRHDRLSRLTLLVTALFLLSAALSVRLPWLQILEPVTFFVPATFLLILRSSAIGTGTPGAPRLPSFAVPVLAVLSVLAGFIGPSYQTLVRTYDLYPSTRTPQALETAAHLIRSHVDDSRRIAVEEMGNAVEARDVFGLVYPMAVLGPATGKSFLGYPCPLQIRGSIASFRGDKLLGLAVAPGMDAELLAGRLEDYNVGWVVTFTPGRGRVLSAMPSVMRPVAEEAGVRVFRVEGDGSFFYRGSGEVRFLPGVIQLRNLEPEDGAVILKTHFAPGLKAAPHADIVRHPMPGNTAGFLKIRNPPENLEIRMSLF